MSTFEVTEVQVPERTCSLLDVAAMKLAMDGRGIATAQDDVDQHVFDKGMDVCRLALDAGESLYAKVARDMVLSGLVRTLAERGQGRVSLGGGREEPLLQVRRGR